MKHKTDQIEAIVTRKSWQSWVYHVILICILIAGAYLRLVGIDWDENQHLHPDERFLTMVEAAIEPVEDLGAYFDTANSSLNPHNRGYGFFVYGTLPIFIVRYVAEWIDQTGYGQVYLVGRALSALVDLGVVWLVYLIAAWVYDRRVGVMAAAFSAFAVLQIQQSHFFTVDTFTNFFMMLAMCFAVRIVISKQRQRKSGELFDAEPEPIDEDAGTQRLTIKFFTSHPLFSPSIYFGIALGMAIASKINAAPIAVVLPGAAALYWSLLTPKERSRQAAQIFLCLVLAGFVSLFTFRIFQPYAFSGPGFLGLKPNELWIENINSLRAQTGGDVDFPPALQWARRPLWFSLQNLIFWGLGAPLGILAWFGFIWMGWRIIKGEWKRHSLLWGWTAIYFCWQSLQWNSTMRYQLPIYPLLAIFAAWCIITAWEKTKRLGPRSLNLKSVSVILVGLMVLMLTFAWAFAFSRIYTRPHTRVAASRWLFQNMPGAVNLSIQTREGHYNQPLYYPQDVTIQPGIPYPLRFTALVRGNLMGIYLPVVVDKMISADVSLMMTVTSISGQNPLAAEKITPDEIAAGGGDTFTYPLSEPVTLTQGDAFNMVISDLEKQGGIAICGPLYINLLTTDGLLERELPILTSCLQGEDLPYKFELVSEVDSILQSVSMAIRVKAPDQSVEVKTLSVELIDSYGEILTSRELSSSFNPLDDPSGGSYYISLQEGIKLSENETYSLLFSLVSGDGEIAFSGSAPANESSWDDGLPLRMDGYDPFGGIYQGGLNFEMYWDDNQEKFERFVATLDQSDYILITSSRQWGSTTRVPERYPLTTEYYKRLLGCPPDHTIEWCYNVADPNGSGNQPGSYLGDLGFQLVKVFQSNPSLGNFEINDQFAEEAFTVYDHPKVFIFKKSDSYDTDQVQEILGAVDLTKVIRITPKQADSYPGNLLLPEDRLETQRINGTWSDYFDPNSIQNQFQIIGVVLWYCSVSLMGLIVYPLVRFAMPGLTDRGYPFARITGLLVLTLLVWLAGSVRIPFNRFTISLVILMITLLGISLGYRQRNQIIKEIGERKNYYLMVEALFLTFFLVGLLIRLGNPDLWHPWKGGEKPMDFSYFNAVLKSTTFPPYDPWFAGGYINYYYYGFVLVGVLVKFLGIVPAIAYNLILPTLFSLIAMGAFSIVWNLVTSESQESGHPSVEGMGKSDQVPVSKAFNIKPLYFASSLLGALFMAVFGNLGILQTFFQGLQKTASPGNDIRFAGFFQKLVWTVSGFFKSISGMPVPIRMDEWYWNPSRVIAYEHGNPITEFPFFTFLYADLHAHLIALPVALLVVVWVISVVRGRAWEHQGSRSWGQVVLGFVIGGLAIGALYPINLSDIYTYLPLGSAALVYAIWRYVDFRQINTLQDRYSSIGKRLFIIFLSIFALYALTQILYQPYKHWYGQGYSEVHIWDGSHTSISEYLTHWGLFLFILVSWMFSETIDWMASTPVSALRKLVPYRGMIWGVLVAAFTFILALGINVYPDGLPPDRIPVGLGVHISWLVFPLAIWSGVLLFRPGISDPKRLVLFFTGTGLVLTLMVELIVVSGDIGRMNTVFKFYLHSWTLFAVSSGVALGWLIKSMSKWSLRLRTVWQVALSFLVFSTMLYPLLGSAAKILDRMEKTAPHTLDGMKYMQYATYHDEGVAMDLSQDYNAIRWMQDNVVGSPVIVEANSVEYHWGTRYTIYTGLPGVVGWNWHQRQQRTATPHDWVFERVDAVHEFYQTEDLQLAQAFLQKYNVSYIILGQLERAKYAGTGLDKFDSQNGTLWQEVFRDRDTVVYEVIGD